MLSGRPAASSLISKADLSIIAVRESEMMLQEERARKISAAQWA